jgi:hypothetical protein
MAYVYSFAANGPLASGLPPSDTVPPFRSSSVALEVVVGGRTADDTRAHLARLMHSPLGVCVTCTYESGNSAVVHLDMAPDDFGFMLDTLFALVPEATVRALRPRADREGN